MSSSQTKKAGFSSPAAVVASTLSLFHASTTLQSLTFEVLPRALSRKTLKLHFDLPRDQDTTSIYTTTLVERDVLGTSSSNTSCFSVGVVEDSSLLAIPDHVLDFFDELDTL